MNANLQYLESSVIGGLLLGGLTPAAQEVLASLEPAAFSIPLYRTVYRVIQRQARARNLIDSLMVAEECGDEHFADVMSTAKHCPSAANLAGYAEMVSQEYQRRQFAVTLDGMRREIISASIEQAGQAMDTLMSRLSLIRRPRLEPIPVVLGEVMGDFTETLERRLNNGLESDTLRLGIAPLDEVTGGVNPQDLVIVAGRPGMGKTSLAMRIATSVAARTLPGTSQRRGVLIFSLEMGAQQLAERGIAAAGGLAVSVLRNPATLDDEGWGRVSQGVAALDGLDIWIVDTARLSVEKIRAMAERQKQAHPTLSLILVDYLGLIDKPRAERHDLAIAHISGSLKSMAKELGTPVIALSQLSREVEKRPNKRPVSADLRDSGSIEQDADLIVMLYRDVIYHPDTPARHHAELIVTKSRFGQAGAVIYQRFINGHFVECDQDEARRLCTPMEQPPLATRYRGARV
ncbi:replicative DNA helicase [Edwardsiella piscicida]|uniref:replicative DNA helicase n=1 Tax=Edwardsiella piscicida TaxID=1263550 RepID=UPI00101ACCD9|nr:replicative DNA helicase [Edwardsiella piscicida]QBB14176.1 replicative DNA helicase [Edwardsiella piscicida]